MATLTALLAVPGTSAGASKSSAPSVAATATPTGRGYWTVQADGTMAAFGDAHPFGGARVSDVVGLAATRTGNGYWLTTASGRVVTFGDAGAYGGLDGRPLVRPVVGMAATPSGKGYWMVAADGGIFTFGDAAFYGSTGSMHLNQPIVGMAATPSGHGYWLVAADGGIFTFGDATFAGSMGGQALSRPIVAMAATASGHGYWLAGADGGIFTFGDATFFGSHADHHTDQRFVGMATTPSGDGYWLVGSGFCYPLLTSTAPVTVAGSSAPPVAQLENVAINIPGCREQAAHVFRSQNVFQYRPPSPALVSFDVRYVRTPTPGPSGQAVQIAGNAFLEVTLHGTTAAGLPTGIQPSAGSPIVAVQQTEDFEGTTRYVIGLSQMIPFWAGQVSDPFQHTNNLVVELG